MPPHVAGATSSKHVGGALRYVRTTSLDGIHEAWRRLSGSLAGRAFVHRWQWHRAIKEHLFEDVVYHCFFDDDELVAVFPLVPIEARRPVRWRGVGLPEHREIFLSDALIDDRFCGPYWSDVLLSELDRSDGQRTDAIVFKRIRARSCIRAGMAVLDRRIRQTVVGRSAYCDCASPAGLASLSEKHLRNVDRLRSRAREELGTVEHVWLTGSEAASSGFDCFMRVEEASWKGPEGTRTSLSCTSRARSFFRGVMKNFAEEGDARVDLLLIGGEPAAAQMALRCDSSWSLLKIGFDQQFARFGPGNILMKLFVERMAEDPSVDEVSLVTAPEWAGRWHMRMEPTYDIALFARTPAGLLLSAQHYAKGLGRAVKQRVRRAS